MSFLRKLFSLFKSDKKKKIRPTVSDSVVQQPSFSIEILTEKEKHICQEASLPEEDALFLKRLTKRPIEKLGFEDQKTNNTKAYAICSLTKEDNARKIVTEFREKFISEGKYIFIGKIAYNGYHVAMTGRTADPYKIMESVGTNGVNFNIETKNIIEKYQKWNKEFGIKPIGIGFDFCEGEIINKQIDYKKLADEVYEFCPDVVEQGTETIVALKEEMERTGSIYLWWD